MWQRIFCEMKELKAECKCPVPPRLVLRKYDGRISNCEQFPCRACVATVLNVRCSCNWNARAGIGIWQCANVLRGLQLACAVISGACTGGRTQARTHSAYDVTLYIVHTQASLYKGAPESAPTLAPRRAVGEGVVEPELPVVAAAEKPRQMRPFQTEIKPVDCLPLTAV